MAGQLKLELFDAELKGRGSNRVLKVTVDKQGGVTIDDCAKMSRDKQGGVTIDDCAKMSRQLGAVLDVEDFIKGSYTLEVSSPGLNRSLKNEADYKRSIGNMVRIVTIEAIDGENVLIGRLEEIIDGGIRLIPDEKKEVVIEFTNISRARLEIDI